MASRHVDVNERRLRPVYDALDSMNNKLAIQLADKILKKQKDLHCAKALKGLALLRSGKTADSETLMEEIRGAQPADDPTLQAMTICYREMQKPEMIPCVYEMALKQNPNNEELYSHLFMAYVRIGNYKKQQQAAMNLYKLFSKNPYYFWAVMSIVMQALVASDKNLGKTMLLPLAEKMVEKFVNESKIDAEAEVRLYLMILEKLEHYEKALGVLRSNLAVKLISYMDEKEEKEAVYLSKLCRWHEANLALKKLIWKRPDQWSYYQSYFTSAFALIKQGCTPDKESEELPDYSVEMINEFLVSVTEFEKSKDKRACRGPFLAQLELDKLCREECMYSDTRQNPSSPVDLLIEYFKRFGDKLCCFWDLEPYLYLNLQETSAREKFVEVLKTTLPSVSDEESESSHIKLMLRKLNMEQISRHLGFHSCLSSDEKIALSKEYMKQHGDGLVYGQNLSPTELQYSDGFAQLATHLLLEVNCDTGRTDVNWYLLIMLESALKASPSNHHFKLLLMKVYCSMGALSPCLALYDGLEVKHIEQDVIGYTVTRYVEALGHFEAASSVYLNTLKFFYGNQKNTPEHIIAAYKYGSFEKIPEFIDLKRRLDLSLHFATVNYENMLLEVFLKANSLSDAQSHFTENNLLDKCSVTKYWMKDLKDNRDLRILQTWDAPERQLSKDQESKCVEQEVLWLRLRFLVLRALAMAVPLVPKPLSNMQTMNNGEAVPEFPLEGVVNELKEILREVDLHPGTRAKLPFLGPPCSRLPGFLDGQHGAVLVAMLTVCHECHHLHYAPQDASSKDRWKSIQENLEKVTGILIGCNAECLSKLTTGSGEKTMFNGQVLEPLVLLVESYCSVILLASVCCSFLQKLAGSKKAKKKKPGSAKTNEEIVPFKDFLTTLRSSVTAVHSALEEVNVAQLSDELLELNLVELDNETKSSIVSEIWEKLQTSYKQSVKEISELLHHKVAFAKSLQI
ncbi:N-alpha-acetyltransferase 25, NatB auxiliary subunit-like isoform X1 [Orbicella faveolata]|uniref:N-alpha-acetyltransferase 25, NatB auxiliary subunit-like isoform X1 n=2 Tax=Orbicella faveolata TaxID=48498 RepID=UPI0009E3A924|nr:N-alpha-acetyltransferase 25, NatB auxiliary subunit-like isoform X1 [Orbicella faveolata]